MRRGSTWAKVAAGVVAGGLLARELRRRQRRIDFDNRVVVITGGSRGLGLVLARRFALQGARLVILARDYAELSRAQQDLEARGASVLAVACDVSNEQQARNAIERTIAHFGRIDVLVNNAGSIQVGPLEHMTVADFEDALAIHFKAPLYMSLAALPHMRHQEGGRIVNISSIGGIVSLPHLVPYSASKHALVGLSGGMHAELAKDSIFVTTVCPGLMRTGSPLNAMIKGRHEDEFTWFAIADSLPLFTISAESAARQIVRACRYGDPHLVVSLPGRVLAFCNAVFPGLMAETMELVHRLLPSPTGAEGSEARPGHQSRSRWAPSILTHLSDAAAARNNELPRNGRH